MSERNFAVTERLTRIEVKLDSLTDAYKENLLAMKKNIEDHEMRLEKIEKVVWVEAGLFMMFAVPTILMVLAELVKKMF